MNQPTITTRRNFNFGLGPTMRATHAALTTFLSLRSTVLLMLVGIVGVTALAWLLGASARASALNGHDTAMPAPFIAFAALGLGLGFYAVAAAVFVCSEYASGTIVTSLQAVPVRGRFLAAKVLVTAGIGALAGAVSIALGTVIAAAAAGEFGAFTGTDFTKATLGATVYIPALMLITAGLAALCRNTAGTITGAFVLFLGLPQILPLFRSEWIADFTAYLPTTAGAAVIAAGPGSATDYGPGVAALILLAWVVSFLGLGYARLRFSDA